MKIVEQSLHDIFYIRELKKRLEIATSIEIKEFNDCKQLSELLNLKGLAVSSHTFARLFAILKDNHRPYTSTLDLICEFLEYRNFSEFCIKIKNEINQALYAPHELFKTGAYSLLALEIAIANNDWIGMKAILDAIDTTKFHIHDLVITLGNAVRAHPMQQELLQELNKTENGGRLFYECYVDEDDRDYYYSNSLKEYYKTANKTKGNQLFLECFLASKAIYQNQKIDIQSFQLIQINDFSYDNLHFHEISRFFEIQLLLDFQNRVLNKTITAHLEKIIYTTTAAVEHSEACWILARSLKALSFAGMLKKAMSYSPFNLLVFKLFKQLNAKIDSIGELIIQFVGHVFFVKNQQEAFQIPPSKIGVKCDNETNARILIESATASLYAKSSVKSILDNNIQSFAKQTNQTWVFELLY